MTESRFFYIFFAIGSFSAYADVSTVPVFKNYPIEVSVGPFAKKLAFTSEQNEKSFDWKGRMSSELNKKVNFAGHYRLVISDKGEFPNECGPKGWVCGWILDKVNGLIVSELPIFNGNSAYFSIVDNGTPSPDPFYIEFYPNRTLLVIGGENTPKAKQGEVSYHDKKCAYISYDFQHEKFLRLFSGACESQ